MVAFLGSMGLSFVMIIAVLVYAERRPLDAVLTWGEAMMASTYAFFVMFWVYGVVPHQWLTWADSELGWRSDAFMAGPGSTAWGIFRDIPISISLAAIRDLIAVLIYGVFLVAHVALWSIWQSRAKRRAAKTAELATTQYGRPLVRGS